MAGEADHDAVGAAIAAARLRAWRTSLLSLHKVLIDSELRHYAEDRGPIGGPHQALRLVSSDPWFAWLRPITAIIIDIDERIADPRAVEAADVAAYASRIRTLLTFDIESPFGTEYRRVLQELPEAVVTHGQLLALLEEKKK